MIRPRGARRRVVMVALLMGALAALGEAIWVNREQLPPPGQNLVVVAPWRRELPSTAALLDSPLPRDFPPTPTTLQALLTDLNDVSGHKIFVNWAALETAGVKRDTPIRLELHRVTLRSALDALRAEMIRHGLAVDWDATDEIVLSSEPDIARSQVATRVYDIRTLLLRRATPAETDAISRSLQSDLGEQVWREHDVKTRELAGQLIVTAPYRDQRVIARSLAWMKWRAGVRETVILNRNRIAGAGLAGALLGAGGEIWLLSRRHRRRLGPGGVPCPRCGYDVRATPERCPECGTHLASTTGK